jgi:ankyrin repeat protein
MDPRWLVDRLIEHSTKAKVPDREGMTLLQTAAWNGHEDVVSILLRCAKDIDARHREGWTALP